MGDGDEQKGRYYEVLVSEKELKPNVTKKIFKKIPYTKVMSKKDYEEVKQTKTLDKFF